MDRSVPAGAALLLDAIGEIETGRKGHEGYDVIFAHAQAKLPKPITQMTIAELQGHQAKGWPAKSTASGRYQFMRATLGDLRNQLGLRDGQVFNPELQDRLGYHLLKRRGYDEFMAGKIGVTEFGKRLAQEWASFPVLAATKGGSRNVVRGQSYYAGDGLNKSLVTPERIETLLASVAALKGVDAPSTPTPAPKPAPIPTVPLPEPAKGKGPPIGLIIIALVAVAIVAAIFFVRF